MTTRWRGTILVAAMAAACGGRGDEEGSPPSRDAPSDAAAAADVVRRYYAAIDRGDYPGAWRLWARDGAASGQTLADFADGFAHTERVEVEVGEPGRVEGAAGSRYVTVPVVVRAVTTEGERQRFEGDYTLRRSVVPGATEAQRRWSLESARIATVPPRLTPRR